MINETINVTSTRKCPYNLILSDFNYSNHYEHMLLEDLTGSFSLEFSHINETRNFFRIEPINDRLNTLLSYERFNYLEYDFERCLGEIFRYLIYKGKAYAEIAILTSEHDEIVGLDIIPIDYKKDIKLGKHIKFHGLTSNKETIKFKINKKYLIKFDLKDIGLSRDFFSKVIKKLRKTSISAPVEFFTDKKLEKIFDYEKYSCTNDYNLIKFCKNIGWVGRNYSNQFLSDSYLLTQRIKFKKIKWRILEYLLLQINSKLSTFKNSCNFNGEIQISVKEKDYEKEYCSFYNGTTTLKSFTDYVYNYSKTISDEVTGTDEQ